MAAGTSSRLGRPKQVLRLGGKPVLQHVLDAAQGGPLDEILVVVGHRAAEITAAVRLPPRARFVHNPDYAEGQSTSLRAGVRAADLASGAAVVLLGDQPGVLPTAIAAVVRGWRKGQGPVVQASYGGRPGHPTLFDRSLWPELERAGGDEGARGLLAAHPEWIQPVAAGDHPPDDIDTEEDYDRVRAAFEPL